ncbi:MAG: hypothetical protein ACQER2_03055 [Bacillota bacterium]
MSVIYIVITFILGLVMLLLGFATKKQWLKTLSIIPFAIFLYSLMRLLAFLFL